MRCFYHGDVEAVAICKSCGHGLCHDCCSEVGTGAACRNRCEGDVGALNEMIERNKTGYQKAAGAYSRSGYFLLILGLIFTGVGASGLGRGEPVWLLIVMGLVFFLYGLSQFFTARRFRAK